MSERKTTLAPTTSEKGSSYRGSSPLPAQDPVIPDQESSHLPENSKGSEPDIIRIASQMHRMQTLNSMKDHLISNNDCSLTKLDNFRKQLVDCHRQFLKTHAQLETSASHEDHEYFKTGTFAKEASLYNSISVEIMRHKGSLLPTPDISVRSPARFPAITPSLCRLPEIPLPTFSGEYIDWPEFRDMFTALVIDREGISDVERLLHLRSSLKPAPLRHISGLPLTAASFTSAWKKLTTEYENKRFLISVHLDKLLNVAPLRSTASSLWTLIATVKGALHSLDALGVITNGFDPLLVHLLTQKMDRSTREQWAILMVQSKEYPSLKSLMDFLQSRARSLEWREVH